MNEDGVRLSNWQYLKLAEKSVKDHMLFMRILSHMDLDAWDYRITMPMQGKMTTQMLQHFTGKAPSRGMNLVHLMHMVPHMNPWMLEAFATFSDQPNELAHVNSYFTRTGLLPTMKYNRGRAMKSQLIFFFFFFW
jgi:hypothetical protein